MIVKSVKTKCTGKTEEKGVSQRTGKDYINKSLYFEDTDGTLLQLGFVNDIVFNKAIAEKYYFLKLYISPYGKITLNDIEEAK